jgi:hypothetical protein
MSKLAGNEALNEQKRQNDYMNRMTENINA